MKKVLWIGLLAILLIAYLYGLTRSGRPTTKEPAKTVEQSFSDGVEASAQARYGEAELFFDQVRDKQPDYPGLDAEIQLLRERQRLSREKARRSAQIGAKLRERAREEANKPPLLLRDFHWEREYGYVIAEGRVENVSDSTLRNLVAVVTWHTEDFNFITSENALTEFNPILPGQATPFRVMARWNPAMYSADVEFRSLGGERIRHRRERR